MIRWRFNKIASEIYQLIHWRLKNKYENETN